jgi:hypothetical protein
VRNGAMRQENLAMRLLMATAVTTVALAGARYYETISSYPGEASKAITVLMPVGLPRISSAACSGG